METESILPKILTEIPSPNIPIPQAPEKPSSESSSEPIFLSKKINKKKIYLKLDKPQLRALKDNFVMTQYYPKKQQITKMSKELNIDVTKIENWLKYERRKLSKMTFLQKYKKRKRFTETDFQFLKTSFQSNPCPNKTEMEALAKVINCSSKNIENWFGNYKKKIKNLNKPITKPSSEQPIFKQPTQSTEKIKVEETKESLEKFPNIDKITPSKTNIPSSNNLNNPLNSLSNQMSFLNSPVIDPNFSKIMSFYQTLQNYMSSPEIIEMQRKNIALTQNFVIYQQLFQTYLMMNFKKKIQSSGSTMPLTKKEELETDITNQQKIIEMSLDKNDNNQKLPAPLQNMMNFINTNFKDKNPKK